MFKAAKDYNNNVTIVVKQQTAHRGVARDNRETQHRDETKTKK